MKILVFNAGSSSQKSRLYEIADSLPALVPAALWEADADWTERPGFAEIKITTGGQTHKEEIQTSSRPEVIEHLLTTLWSGPAKVINQPSDIDIVGHRVVHGGQEFEESTLITEAVKTAVKNLAVLAPAHNPANLEGIEVAERLLPDVPQVAVFDTAFHRQLPLPAVVYPGPYEWFEQGIRRFGFHGISYQYCTQRTAQILGKDLKTLRLIVCHLGNGCSLAAIREGHSIETTMGFTPMEGVMMGARSGSLDPGILLYLLREKGYSAQQLDTTLNTASGLKGVSGVSSDLRKVMQAKAEGNQRAKLAFDIYVHRLRYYAGAMLATLAGLDALVFAGGVGEHSAEVRASVCEAFGFLGLKLDAEKNAQSPIDTDVATADSSVRVVIVQTQEDWTIAQECWKMGQQRLKK